MKLQWGLPNNAGLKAVAVIGKFHEIDVISNNVLSKTDSKCQIINNFCSLRGEVRCSYPPRHLWICI